MFRLAHHAQIGRGIVPLVSVQVVDDFILAKIAPQVEFHDYTMFEAFAPRRPDHPISIRSTPPPAIPCRVRFTSKATGSLFCRSALNPFAVKRLYYRWAAHPMRRRKFSYRFTGQIARCNLRVGEADLTIRIVLRNVIPHGGARPAARGSWARKR